ncbi:MAG: hypothetical protein L0G10_12780 [Acinetobacter sp.]|nr:hypothetical protein [Acinetobacter sp.]
MKRTVRIRKSKIMDILKKGMTMKIKFLTVSLMFILPFSVLAANGQVEEAVIESNNAYKSKYN